MSKDEINAFLGAGTVYNGKLNFQGSVRIDGSFTGEINSEGTLIVGKEANLQGQFNVGQIIISGKVQGTVVAAKKAVLHRTAQMMGTLNTPSLVIEEGAVLQGDVVMKDTENPAATSEDSK
ncbi:bactofilin family protein [Oleidesulfovibrio sp.]|uniref:bactofilin family protein n=1 Tax=Oleidesulfovibrio sp. TaxID=2909707 RepID=UPI003A89B834